MSVLELFLHPSATGAEFGIVNHTRRVRGLRLGFVNVVARFRAAASAAGTGAAPEPVRCARRCGCIWGRIGAIDGGTGNDILFGGSGQDTITDPSGLDQLPPASPYFSFLHGPASEQSRPELAWAPAC